MKARRNPFQTLLIVALCILFGPSVAIAQHTALRAEVDKIIRFDTDISYKEHPGYVIGIIDNDSTYILNFGIENIDTFDNFEIGGLSKVFTADLVISLAEKGMINLDQKINSFFPAKYQNQHLEQYDLTDLLTHQIRFPKRPSNLSKKEFELSNPYAYYTKNDVLAFYESFIPPRKRKWTREILHYSHINYALLEIIIESTLNLPFEKVLQQYFLENLDLDNTTSNLKLDYISNGYDYKQEIPSPWTYQSFRASEGLYSNLDDLLRFLRINLGLTPIQNQSVIDHSLLKQKESKISKNLAHSLSWYILSSRKMGQVYTHSGSTQRHKVYMHFKPSTNTGVVILSRSVEGTGELGMLVLRLINYNWKRKNNGKEKQER